MHLIIVPFVFGGLFLKIYNNSKIHSLGADSKTLQDRMGNVKSKNKNQERKNK